MGLSAFDVEAFLAKQPRRVREHECPDRCHACPLLKAAIGDGIRKGLRGPMLPGEGVMPTCIGRAATGNCTCPKTLNDYDRDLAELKRRVRELENAVDHFRRLASGPRDG